MGKKKVTITFYPYAVQYGTIEVDEGVNIDDEYINEHFNEIKLEKPELDYVGTDFEIIED